MVVWLCLLAWNAAENHTTWWKDSVKEWTSHCRDLEPWPLRWVRWWRESPAPLMIWPQHKHMHKLSTRTNTWRKANDDEVSTCGHQWNKNHQHHYHCCHDLRHHSLDATSLDLIEYERPVNCYTVWQHRVASGPESSEIKYSFKFPVQLKRLLYTGSTAKGPFLQYVTI